MIRRASGFLASMLLASMLLAGCSVAARGGEGGAGSGDLAEVKRRVVELQEQARMSEIEIARLRKKVAELEARLGISSPTPSRSTPTAPATTLRSEPRREPTTRESPMLEEIDLEAEDIPAEPPRERSPAPPPARSGPTTAVTPEAQQLYDQGYTLYHRGRYLDAEALFQQFLRAHGSTDLADNAQYWIGESYLNQRQNDRALEAFDIVIREYPDSNKRSDAYYKKAVTLESMERRSEAMLMYELVIEQFPRTQVERLARRRLEQLMRTTQPRS